MAPLRALATALLLLAFTGAHAANLLSNPDFEAGNLGGWYAFAAAGDLVLSSDACHSGGYCARIENRSANYAGPAQDLLGLLSAGVRYDLSIWVRLENAGPESLAIYLKQVDGAGTHYIEVDSTSVATEDGWVQLWAPFVYQPSGSVTTLTLYITSATAAVNYTVDDAELRPYDPAYSVTPATAADFVHASGRDLVVGANNRLMRLQGVNFNAYDEEGSDLEQVYASKNNGPEDYQRVAATGLNVVRLNLWWKLFEDEGNPYNYTATGWQWLERHIGWARDAGVYLILDLHAPIGGFQGPDSATGFWDDADWRARTLALWVAIASRYKDEPWIAGYDLLNEPNPYSDADWQAYAQSLTDAIRTVDTHHLLIVEQSFAADAEAFLIDDPQGNVAYDFHFYTPWKYAAQMSATHGYGYQGSYPDDATPVIPWDWNNVGSVQNPVIPTGDSAWSWYEGALFTINDANIFGASPLLISGTNAGALYFDDFEVNEYDAEGNFVRTLMRLDPEPRPSDWYAHDDEEPMLSYAEYWSRRVVSGSGTKAQVSDAHAGTRAWSLSAVSGEVWIFNHQLIFPVRQGYQYQISGWIKGVGVTDQSGSFGLRLHGYKAWDGFQPLNRAYLEEQLIASGLTFYIDHQVPVNIGEFGVSNGAWVRDNGAAAWTQDLLDLFAQYRISYQYFQWHAAIFGIYDNPYGFPHENYANTELLGILSSHLASQTTDDDSDADGMPDSWELAHGLNPGDPSDAVLDPDGDYVSNYAEYQADSDPNTFDHFATAPATTPPAVAAHTAIKVDQFGYLPGAQKVAVIANPVSGFDTSEAYAPGSRFEVRRTSDDSVAFSSTISAWNSGATDPASGDQVWWFDFSALTEAGEYQVVDPSTGEHSYTFAIGAGVYSEVMRHALRTFFYQRAGQAKVPPYADARWADPASHAQDAEALLMDAADPSGGDPATVRDLSGGWYDAGDFNKYVNYADGALHDLLYAYSEHPDVWGDDYAIPESGNGIPDLLDEVKYELDWLLKMQLADGSVLHKVASYEWGEVSPPSTDAIARRYAPATASATISAAGAFAHAARVYSARPEAALQAYAATLESAAVAAWNWLDANPSAIPSNFDNAGFVNAVAEDCLWNGDCDTPQRANRVAAAIYLYALTGESAYAEHIVANASAYVLLLSDGYLIPNGVSSELVSALLLYTTLPGADATLVGEIETAFAEALSMPYAWTPFSPLARFQEGYDAYRAYLDDYIWGSNRDKGIAGNFMLAAIAYGQAGTDASDYRNGADGYLHYLHGVNPQAIAYLSNMYESGAEQSVSEFYHMWYADGSALWDSVFDSTYGPAPGFLVGGPNAAYSMASSVYIDDLVQADHLMANQPDLKAYWSWNRVADASYEVTENHIPYQAAYIRLLAASLPSLAPSGPADSDGDGIPDATEALHGTDPHSATGLLQGSSLDDTLSGGAGAELIIGGLGRDTLSGGGGADVFVLQSRDDKGDEFTDFDPLDDRFSVVELLAAEGLSVSVGAVSDGYFSAAARRGITYLYFNPPGERAVTLGKLNGVAPSAITDAQFVW